MFRWARECMGSRRRGQPEPTLERFQALRGRRPVIARLNEWRKDYGKMCYRAGGLSFSLGRPIRCRLKLLLAGLLHPRDVRRRLYRQKLHVWLTLGKPPVNRE